MNSAMIEEFSDEQAGIANDIRDWLARMGDMSVAQGAGALGLPHRTLEHIIYLDAFRYPRMLRLAMHDLEVRRGSA